MEQTHLPLPAFIADAHGCYTLGRPVTEAELLAFANGVIARRFERSDVITQPEMARDFLVSRLASLESEVFCAIFLDNRHRVIEFKELFQGTIDGASVYPREVVKAALARNAAAIILAHNHPSGVPEPSESDKQITRRLKDALALVDVRVLDHIIVGGTAAVSMAERGLIA